MFKRILIVMAVVFSLGFGYVAYRATVPMLVADPEAQAILAQVRGNIESLGAVTADVDCYSNRPWLGFLDGSMAAQGETNFWIDKGTLGEVVWRNDVGFNHSSPGNEIIQEPHVGWLRWDNSTQNAFANWACTEGIGDVRIPLGMAEMHPVGCAVVPGLHLVGGVSCKKLESIGFRIFVDAANPHRLIRVEIDRAGLGGGLAHAADFLNWQDFGLGEYPTLINSTQFNHDPVVGDSVWTYSFSNIQVNANLPAGLFDLEFQ